MLLFTDGSAINNPSPTGAAVVIRKNGPTNVPIKLTKAIKNLQALPTKKNLKELISAPNRLKKIY